MSQEIRGFCHKTFRDHIRFRGNPPAEPEACTGFRVIPGARNYPGPARRAPPIPPANLSLCPGGSGAAGGFLRRCHTTFGRRFANHLHSSLTPLVQETLLPAPVPSRLLPQSSQWYFPSPACGEIAARPGIQRRVIMRSMGKNSPFSSANMGNVKISA